MSEDVTIFGMKIKVDVSKVSHGKLTSLPENMISLKILILKNYAKTGFLMCISSYCIACIYQRNTKEKQLFSLLAYEDSISSTMKHIKHISGINKLMEAILNIVQNKQCQTMEYDIQFIHCSSETPESERKRIIRKRRKKHIYDNLEPAAKKRTAEKMQKKYSKMNPTNKKELLCKSAQKYKTMDVSLKNEMLSNLKVKYQKRMMDKGTSIQSCIKEFKKKITEGPYFICIVCNRLLYKKSVIRCITSKYPCQAFFKIQQSFDGKEYICKTCHSKVIKGKLPCQGIMNNMYVVETPSELASIEKLEQILIAKRIVFQKIVVMPKGQQKKN